MLGLAFQLLATHCSGSPVGEWPSTDFPSIPFARLQTKSANTAPGKKVGRPFLRLHEHSKFRSRPESSSSGVRLNRMPGQCVALNRSRTRFFHRGIVTRSCQPGHIQQGRAAAVNHRVQALRRQAFVHISDVAKIIVECSIDIHAQSQIQCQVLLNLPVVLRKEAENVCAVFVVKHATAAEAERASSQQEILPVGQAIRGV